MPKAPDHFRLELARRSGRTPRVGETEPEEPEARPEVALGLSLQPRAAGRASPRPHLASGGPGTPSPGGSGFSPRAPPPSGGNRPIPPPIRALEPLSNWLGHWPIDCSTKLSRGSPPLPQANGKQAPGLVPPRVESREPIENGCGTVARPAVGGVARGARTGAWLGQPPTSSRAHGCVGPGRPRGPARGRRRPWATVSPFPEPPLPGRGRRGRVSAWLGGYQDTCRGLRCRRRGDVTPL